MRRGSFADLLLLVLAASLVPGCGNRREPLKPPSYLLRGGDSAGGDKAYYGTPRNSKGRIREGPPIAVGAEVLTISSRKQVLRKKPPPGRKGRRRRRREGEIGRTAVGSGSLPAAREYAEPEGASRSGGGGGQGKKPSPVIKHLQQESKRLARSGRGARYLSPATPKRRKLGRAVDISKETVSAPSSSEESSLTAPQSELDSPVSELKAEILSVVVEDPGIAGSYRLQLCLRESFDRIFFDKTYEFMAEVDFIKDLHDKGIEPGPYWIRVAFVDLLGFAHPFSKPKRYILK